MSHRLRKCLLSRFIQVSEYVKTKVLLQTFFEKSATGIFSQSMAHMQSGRGLITVQTALLACTSTISFSLLSLVCLSRIAQSLEMLVTSLDVEEGEPVQRNTPNVGFTVSCPPTVEAQGLRVQSRSLDVSPLSSLSSARGTAILPCVLVIVQAGVM